jgi:hypothetical protein
MRVKFNYCPKCGYMPLHESGVKGFRVWLLSLLGYRYYRCRRCGGIFPGKAGLLGALPPGKRRKFDSPLPPQGTESRHHHPHHHRHPR